MGRWRQQPQHFYDRRRQFALSPNLFRESVELFDVGQLAVEQQVSDFLEAGPLRHFMNVVAAIHQPGIRIDPADRRFARDYTGQAGAVLWFGFGSHAWFSFTRESGTFKRFDNLTIQRPLQLSAFGS